MNQPTIEEFDSSRTGCPDTSDGRHLIEWVNVPALRFNDGKLPFLMPPNHVARGKQRIEQREVAPPETFGEPGK